MTKSNGIVLLSFIVCFSLLTEQGCQKHHDPVLPPTLTGFNVTDIELTTAKANSIVISDGGAAITGRGVCWSTSESPTIADSKSQDGVGNAPFTSNLTGLTENTVYHARSYATNSAGTGYSSDVQFKTLHVVYSTPLSDIDGNEYQFVTIGAQVWMAENLKVTRLTDGTDIPQVTSDLEWANLSTSAYSVYANDVHNKDTYGALYNFYAVNTGKLCPAGSHVPTEAEWLTMTGYVENRDDKLKEAGTAHWPADTGASNSTGFTALPAGGRFADGSFSNIGVVSIWWGSTAPEAGSGWSISLELAAAGVSSGAGSQELGLSVRCVKD